MKIELCNLLELNPWPEAVGKSDSEELGPEEPLKENLWGFGTFSWPKIQREFGTVERLYAAIQDLYEEIRALKEAYRGMAKSFPEFRVELNEFGGVSGSYFLIDEEGKRRYVVKPLDEDVGAIHSRTYPTPFYKNPIRGYVPLYLSSMREALAYQVAQMIGVPSIVPKTELSLIESEKFHDFLEGIQPEERERYKEFCPNVPDKEKLVSVQEYVEGAKSLFEVLHELQAAGLSDLEIASRFDQANYEDANILLWTTYDTDGHGGNFLIYPKEENGLLGFKKIDNGLAFPDQNIGFRNGLAYLPNASQELSPEAKAKILAIDVEELAKQFEEMGLGSAIPALKKRMAFLKKLCLKEHITIREIHRRISKIGKKI